MIVDIISCIFIGIGLFFVITGSLGILRMPNFFCRLHPAGVTDAAGAPMILIGLMIKSGFTILSLKMFILMVLIIITSPTACYALAKAAFWDRANAKEGKHLSSADEKGKDAKKP